MDNIVVETILKSLAGKFGCDRFCLSVDSYYRKDEDGQYYLEKTYYLHMGDLGCERFESEEQLMAHLDNIFSPKNIADVAERIANG